MVSFIRPSAWGDIGGKASGGRGRGVGGGVGAERGGGGEGGQGAKKGEDANGPCPTRSNSKP